VIVYVTVTWEGYCRADHFYVRGTAWEEGKARRHKGTKVTAGNGAGNERRSPTCFSRTAKRILTLFPGPFFRAFSGPAVETEKVVQRKPDEMTGRKGT
jgi:hypothetical protein